MTSDNTDRAVFRRTVLRVFAVQIIALLLLWLIQARYTP
jgi:hypothetical protein